MRLVVLLILLLMSAGLFVTYSIMNNKDKYIYVARGIQCKDFDKESNTLTGCQDGTFGEVELINPISVIKFRVK